MYKDTAFSSYRLERHCIFFKLHSLLPSNCHVQRHCILFFLWCTKLHFLQTAMYKDTAFPSYSGRKTPSYLLTLLMWDTAFSSHVHEQRHCILSHVHEQRHCILSTCPWAKTLHSLHMSMCKDTTFFHMSMDKDTALSSHVHGHQNSLTRSFTVKISKNDHLPNKNRLKNTKLALFQPFRLAPNNNSQPLLLPSRSVTG